MPTQPAGASISQSRPIIMVPGRRQWGLLIWVVFAGFLFVVPYDRQAAIVEWALTALAVAIFAALYIAFWLEQSRLPWFIAGSVILGLAAAPFNQAAAMFFIYAAAFAPFMFRETRIYAAFVAGLIVVVAIESWVFGLGPGFWAIAGGVSVVVSVANASTAKMAMTGEKLRMANEEIDRLARIAERQRIARDLHDVLGHTLSVIVVKAELAERLIDRDIAGARSEIVAVQDISREALAEVREAVRGYRAEGVPAELERARSVLQSAGVAVECHADDIPLPPAQESVLALALREAITNVVRHAQAATCRLRFERIAGGCRLEISDDGRGGAHVEGYGIRGMRERVEGLGGTLVHDTARGTTLTITLPLDVS
jgi:two-component system, NarL family, sensor histidine kinase DesK